LSFLTYKSVLPTLGLMLIFFKVNKIALDNSMSKVFCVYGAAIVTEEKKLKLRSKAAIIESLKKNKV